MDKFISCVFFCLAPLENRERERAVQKQMKRSMTSVCSIIPCVVDVDVVCYWRKVTNLRFCRPPTR